MLTAPAKEIQEEVHNRSQTLDNLAGLVSSHVKALIEQLSMQKVATAAILDLLIRCQALLQGAHAQKIIDNGLD